MHEEKFQFTYKVYGAVEELTAEQQSLFNKAREVTQHAYAPYSNFKVGAAAKLLNGEVLTGSNQENASFPVGLCAERILVGAISSLHPAVPVEAIAISYDCENHSCDYPVAPCGICRQTLQELEHRGKQSIQLILGGKTGLVYVIDGISNLLPLVFSNKELNNR